MSDILDRVGVVTVVLVAAFVAAAIGGAVVVIVHPDTLNFETYLNDLEKFAVALGILGVGRGVNAGLTSAGDKISLANAISGKAAGYVPDPEADDSGAK